MLADTGQQNHLLAALHRCLPQPLVTELGIGAADCLRSVGDAAAPKRMKARARGSHRPSLTPMSLAANHPRWILPKCCRRRVSVFHAASYGKAAGKLRRCESALSWLDAARVGCRSALWDASSSA